MEVGLTLDLFFCAYFFFAGNSREKCGFAGTTLIPKENLPYCYL